MAKFLHSFIFGGLGAVTRFGNIGLLIQRLAFGLGMAIGHGWGKVYQDGHVGPPQMLIDGVKSMGFPAPTLFAWLAALTEFLGAILLAAGLMTRPVAIALTFNMAVAAFVAHAKDPLFAGGPGASKEFALLFLFGFATFIFTGSGRYGIDFLVRKSSPPPRTA